MQTISLGDVDLAVEDRGVGPVLLLVHGFPLDHSMWRAQIDEFSQRYRVLAPDLRGFGASGPGRGLGSGECSGEITMRRYADDLAVLLDRLGIRDSIVYCGLSMGGYVAWQFWQKCADRLDGLVVCDTRAVGDTPQAKAGRAELAARVLAEGAKAAADAMLPKLFGPESQRDHPQAIEQTRAAILGNPPAGIAAALHGMATRPDATEMLAGIDVPTLVVVGEHDSISPVAEMRGIAERIPGAELAVIRNAGHMSPLEEPRAFNDALGRFLERVSQHE
ncbi:MAG TPA: alpha/beta fold hydrolase [Pirellulales bacterium]|jgi:pimeloyl-ACP methyl ester carboxylesterase|nr:alpha/beta fold hydrolase [Pirellulales bacterium]